MSSGPRLVHKQFNSPIGLYSQQNIKETLSKHIQDLGNGTVGIDFNNPNTDKPANLANSAVLRMLEEEERNRRGYPKLDETQVTAILETMVRVNHRFEGVWPPARGMRAARSWDGQLNATNNVYSEFLRATKGKDQKKVVWPPAPETNGYHSPQAHAQAYGSQPNYPASQQDYSAPPFSPPPEYQKTFSPPPSTITLRQQPPVHQKPPPVFASQPAAASFNGGVNMRGDQKWPPQEVREAVAAENEARRQLAKGPACRPRKVKKDYTSFFSQHALNNNYPGYRAPPGTQHYEELSGRSSY
ncbi:uncharacterized protein LOC105384464 isoform X6 [Plutella xylostella]|uniref:uncharacterized protein LOC105384464 isoform X6 n=1 Tax=Plutella xylostella TaxID=51655 RepID=UPI0018D00CA5|nr:uncharacterized protein LOC105384464 isoform X6 [Plutella xylostella]